MVCLVEGMAECPVEDEAVTVSDRVVQVEVVLEKSKWT